MMEKTEIYDLDFLTTSYNKEGIAVFKHSLKKNGFTPILMGESDYMLNYQ